MDFNDPKGHNKVALRFNLSYHAELLLSLARLSASILLC
jgi:hypothetical protein